ncbi:helix-turn-helix transcriptional regulator [Streptomyces sp. NPDC026659]|uniref:helix-turn-helix domain-containing protein n=1 Tax=Streptomyces sp. NPDC026659 TaxID=3155123 RepID=UPI0033DEA44B
MKGGRCVTERGWRYDEPTARQVRLGHVLEGLRKDAGMSQREVASALDWKGGASKPSRIESGRLGISEADLERLLTLYGVTDQGLKAYILHLKHRGNERGWETQVRAVSAAYADLIGYEGDAESAYNVQLTAIPGLLHTPDYASAVMDQHTPDISEEGREERLAIRARRQEVFKRPNPLMFWGVISESVFEHVLGSPQVMADQLDHLLDLCEEYPHNITIQVLPKKAASHAALFGPFVILSFPERWEPDIVYVEGYTSTRFLEAAGEVKEYSNLFRRLMVTDSLRESESIELIRKYADDYRKG